MPPVARPFQTPFDSDKCQHGPLITELFSYKLKGTGWAKVSFTSLDQTISFEVSYLSDPLKELFEALNRLSDKRTTSEKIIFPEEPG